MRWEELVSTYRKIVICGGPRTGKTTLALSAAPHPLIVATDQYMNLPWEDVPLVVNKRLAPEPSFIVEGVQTARMLRKGVVALQKEEEGGLWPDAVIWLEKVHRQDNKLGEKHKAMAKGVFTVFREWYYHYTHLKLQVNPNILEIAVFKQEGDEFVPFAIPYESMPRITPRR